MRFVVLGVGLALAWFLLVNLAASAAAAAVLRRVRRAGSAAAAGWFWLRIAPSLTALAFVATVVVPAYLRFEPRNTAEPLGLGVSLLAVAALALILRGQARSIAGWRRAARQAGLWMRDAEPFDQPDVPVPVYRIRHSWPVVTLVGVVRQRLFIARQVVDVLTPDELRLVLAHEAGHHGAWDNLKRLVLLASPDALAWAPVGHEAETRWTCAAESRADCYAVRNDPARALTLSAALVKVARLMPAMPRLHGPVSSLDDGGLLTGRVQQLVHFAPEGRRNPVRRWLAIGLGLAIAALLLAATMVLVAPVHYLNELLVRLAA